MLLRSVVAPSDYEDIAGGLPLTRRRTRHSRNMTSSAIVSSPFVDDDICSMNTRSSTNEPNVIAVSNIWYNAQSRSHSQQAVREAATICPRPCKLTFDLLTLKVMSESRVTWSTSVQILAFLGLSILDLGPMYATDRRQTDVRRASSLNAPTLEAGHNNR